MSQPLPPEELLLRQVHPGFIQQDRISSQAFKLSSSDEGLLSIDVGSKTTPEGAWRNYTEIQSLASAGVWGILASDCQSIDLMAYNSPTTRNPSHGHIDFTMVSNSAAEKKAKILARKANDRGALFIPLESP